MSTEKRTKLNNLLQATSHGVVLLSSWLAEQGYSLDLQKRYKKSNWLQSVGVGAVIRTGDNVDYHGGLYALQTQAKLSVHVGGRTALLLQGKGHYLEMDQTRVVLFGESREKLPSWFQRYDWKVTFNYFPTSFLSTPCGLVDLDIKDFSVKISSPARAMLECLYLVPKHQEFVECYELMEGLNNLKPTLVQLLLANCSSVKVKRLFLYLAEKCDHNWLEFVDLSKFDLGTGKRSLFKNGVYVDKYKITVPKEFEKDEKPEL